MRSVVICSHSLITGIGIAQFQDSERIFVFPTRQSLQLFQTGYLANKYSELAGSFQAGKTASHLHAPNMMASRYSVRASGWSLKITVEPVASPAHAFLPAPARHQAGREYKTFRRLGETGGEGGIRTLGTLLRYNALAKRRFRPLSHLT